MLVKYGGRDESGVHRKAACVCVRATFRGPIDCMELVSQDMYVCMYVYM